MLRDVDIKMVHHHWYVSHLLELVDPTEVDYVTIDINKASQIIEAILLRLEFPSFYCYDLLNDFNEQGKLKLHLYSGHKIVSAIKQFIDNKFALTGLKFLPYVDELEGKLFNELGRRYQRRIKEAVVGVTIQAYTTEEVIPVIEEQVKLLQSLQ